ncbi:MAG: KilA-N domain-containing protein [Bacteroidota bacterium]
MKTNKTINVKGTEIAIVQKGKDDFISLTDMVRGFGDDTMIYSWMRNRNTLEFIGIWEEMNNPDFKGNEFVTFKSKAHFILNKSYLNYEN